MPRLTAPPPWWRRTLSALWRAARVTFRLLFMLSMAVLPIPVGTMFYRPHRERRNHPAQVLKKE